MVSFSNRLFRHVRSALQMLLYAAALAMPGIVQAALNGCPHDRTRIAAAAPAQFEGACDETMNAAPMAHHDGDTSSKETKSPCCGIGTSCVAALALPAAQFDTSYFALAPSPLAGRLPTFASISPIPDYPPPRA